MTMVNDAALAHVLGGVELETGAARRVGVPAGDVLALPAGAIALVYVVSGAVVEPSARRFRCRLDTDAAAPRVELSAGPSRLAAGDALLTLGGSGVALRAEDGASALPAERAASGAVVLIVDLVLSATASRLTTVLPDTITVTDFVALEPAAAALAATMGADDASGRPVLQGDPLICRMMATTVLLALIRAWAAHGCAPTGWPSVSNDPFLDRVVDAIHERPGHGWTVERLAGVSAMSRSTFAERFRSALGRSPADYVAAVRVEEAKRMLGAGRSVSETSRALGYASDEGFSRAFRRRTGMTPSAWRLAQRETASA